MGNARCAGKLNRVGEINVFDSFSGRTRDKARLDSLNLARQREIEVKIRIRYSIKYLAKRRV
jgi:hypothetical protein